MEGHSVEVSNPRVVVIDDDLRTTAMFGRFLSREGFETTVARTGLGGIRLVARVMPHLALVELRLPDMSGVEVVRRIRSAGTGVTCVIVSRSGDVPAAVEAMRAGASDFVQKPVPRQRLAVVARSALERSHRLLGSPSLERATAHSLRRWSSVVVRLIDCPSDARTLEAWGHFVGASVGTLRNWCRTARLSSRRSLQFARVLRAVVRGAGDGSLPEHLLDIVDQRTLAKLLALGGCQAPRTDRLPTLTDFLRNQRLIESPMAVAEVRSALTAHLGKARSETMALPDARMPADRLRG